MSAFPASPYAREWRVEHARQGDKALERAEAALLLGEVDVADSWKEIAYTHYKAAELERGD